MQTLIDQGIRLRSWQPGNHKIRCPQCSDSRKPANRKDPCLSVTIDRDEGAVWHCHNCGWSGNVPGRARQAEQAQRQTRQRSYRTPAPPPPDPDRAWFEAWMQGRGISPATTERAGAYPCRAWMPKGGEQRTIAFPYRVGGQTVNVKYRSEDKQFRQEKDARPSLYAIDLADPSAPLVIVEGEMDVLACLEAGVANPVSLPGGAPATDSEDEAARRLEPLATHAELLGQFREIVIATDTDAAGDRLAELLARRFGRDRCKRVAWPDANDAPCKDANEVLLDHGPEVLRECIAAAKPWPVQGLHAPAEFFADVWAEYRGEGPKPVSTGFGSMDAFYRVFPGDFCVVTGVPNHGKSSWLDQVMVQMASSHGWRFAIFSPEHRPATHLIRLAERHVGAPFRDGIVRRMSEHDLTRSLDWIQERFRFIGPGEEAPTIEFILEAARGAALRDGIKGLVVDPWNEVESTRKRDETEAEFIGRAISRLKHFGRQHDVAVWVVAHPTKQQKDGQGRIQAPGLYDISGSAHWANKADAGLVVHRDPEAKATWVHVRKIREQPERGSIGRVQFRYAMLSRRYEETGETEAMT